MHVLLGAARPNFARALFAAALTLLLAACATQARQTFDFDGAAPMSRALPVKISATVGVSEPTATGPVAGDRVVVRQSDDSLAVLPGVQWSDRLTVLFQRRIIEALERAGVSASRSSVNASVRLSTDVRRFEIDVARDLAIVEVSVRLIGEANNKERAAAILVAEYPAPEHTGPPGVRALGQAAEDAARKVAQWARQRL